MNKKGVEKEQEEGGGEKKNRKAGLPACSNNKLKTFGSALSFLRAETCVRVVAS